MSRGYPIQHHVLDNECSAELKTAFAKYNIDYQLVPPAEHRVNASERAIRTFKNHLIATFCTVDSQFPMSEPHLHAVTHQANLQQESFNQLSY